MKITFWSSYLWLASRLVDAPEPVYLVMVQIWVAAPFSMSQPRLLGLAPLQVQAWASGSEQQRVCSLVSGWPSVGAAVAFEELV